MTERRGTKLILAVSDGQARMYASEYDHTHGLMEDVAVVQVQPHDLPESVIGYDAIDAVMDKAKTLVGVGTDRAHALREAIMCCRKAGTISVPGVYVGFPDKIPFGAFMNKGLTMKTGQTHTQKYMAPLLQMVVEGRIDPSFVISHRLPLEEAAQGYRLFKEHQDEVTKVVLRPN